MKVRKSAFVLALFGLLFGSCYFAQRACQSAARAPRTVADGVDPMPLPRPTRGIAMASLDGAPEAALADGVDPMPSPRPPRRLS